MSRFQNSLYLGDIQARVSVLRETGQCESGLVILFSVKFLANIPRSTGLLHCQDEWT